MNSFTQSLQDSMFIAALFLAALFIICTISLALRNYEIRHELKKLKKWRKFSEIEKRQKHEDYDRIATELSEEREFNDTQGSMHVKLMLKYAHVQEESEKTKHVLAQKETFITELKKELKQYQDAVKDLRVEVDRLKAKSERKRDLMGRYVKQSDVIERDWTQASKEELLAEAKRRYPVGTKFEIAHIKNETRTVKDHNLTSNTFIDGELGFHVNFNVILFDGIDCNEASVYCSSKGWAQIITE